MSAPDSGHLKSQVRDFWNVQSCDTQVASAPRFTKDYFEQIETFRYYDQPFIHSFAQFSRYRDKRVLEVGFGAGTDFIQWLRSGARATGIDLTPEALQNLSHRIQVYNLPQPEQILVSDAENLPLKDNEFDLGYSFGVLHHSPNTEKAIAELIRVVKPGGEFKIMVYNRYAVTIMSQWVKFALLKGRPWKSLDWILWNYVESIGTKGYSRKDLVRLFSKLPAENLQIQSEVTAADYLAACTFPPLNWFFKGLLWLGGQSYPWRQDQYVARKNDPGRTAGELTLEEKKPRDPKAVWLTGNPFGFFHCISGTKKKNLL